MRLACTRVADGGPVLTGSVKSNCADCNAEVWIHKDSEEALLQGAVVTCMNCLASPKLAERSIEFTFLPGQIERMNKKLGFDFTEDEWKAMAGAALADITATELNIEEEKKGDA